MLKAFLLGLCEFRSSLTTHFEGHQGEAYDRGRELAHRLTWRLFEQA